MEEKTISNAKLRIDIYENTYDSVDECDKVTDELNGIVDVLNKTKMKMLCSSERVEIMDHIVEIDKLLKSIAERQWHICSEAFGVR